MQTPIEDIVQDEAAIVAAAHALRDEAVAMLGGKACAVFMTPRLHHPA